MITTHDTDRADQSAAYSFDLGWTRSFRITHVLKSNLYNIIMQSGTCSLVNIAKLYNKVA